MAHLWLIMLLISLNTPRLDAVTCDEPFANFPFSEENLCIDMDTQPSYNLSGPYKLDSKDIKTRLIKEDAVLEVRFPLANSAVCYTYALELLVGKAVDNKCSGSEMKVHSTHSFDVFRCSDLKGYDIKDCTPICNKTGVVKFKYIFTGCYQVKITPRNDKTIYRGTKSVGPELLVTNYTKQLIPDDRPFIHYECSDDGHDRNGQLQKEVKGYFTRNDSLADLPITMVLMVDIELSKGSEACTTSGKPHACCTFNPAAGGLFNCQPKGVKAPEFCKLQKRDNNTLVCSFKNISVGNHCLTFELHDKIRCKNYNSVWFDPESSCLFKQEIHCNKGPPPTTESPPTDNGLNHIFISVAAIVAVCFIACISYFLFRRHKHPRGRNLDFGLSSTPIYKSHPRVLLLYAQDCKEFMKLMTTFRSVLSNVGECQVLDCFDPDGDGKIVDNPVAWMRLNASSPEVKVVLVASECAMRHQTALERSTELRYLDPLPCSHLFQYGLQEVTNNPKREYTNTFVVRFDSTNVKYVTSFTRYMLPLYLKDLLSSLNPGLDLSNIEEFRDVQRLQENHEELICFKQENPEYFTKLIVKIEDPVIV